MKRMHVHGFFFIFLALAAVMSVSPGQEEKAAPAAPAAPVKEDRYLLIRGGDLYTVTGPVLESFDILAKNGVIQVLGKKLAAPEGAEILDVSGMRVYPGLIAVSSAGVLGKEPPEDSTDLFSLDLKLALAGGLTTVVTGNTAAKPTFGTTEGMVVKRNLFLDISYTRGAPQKRRELRSDLTKVRDYLRDLKVYEASKGSVAGEGKEPDNKWLKGKYENYLKLLRGEIRAKASAEETQDLVDYCELAERFGFELVIDGGIEAWTLADRLGRAGVMCILNPRRKDDPDRTVNRATGSTLENAAVLHAHGVVIAILPAGRRISLGGIAGRDIMALPLEAAFAVQGGLPEEAALEAITIGAARILGVEDRVGSIEEGKDADFAICDGDLLHYNTLVQWTVVNGRVVYDKEKESLFRHIRPREGRDAGMIDFWPRPFEEMPDGEGAKESSPSTKAPVPE